jgi:hypothetical protein
MSEAKSYVRTDEHGAMRVGQTRVPLESVIYAFQEGDSPESIRQQYPALSDCPIRGDFPKSLGCEVISIPAT